MLKRAQTFFLIRGYRSSIVFHSVALQFSYSWKMRQCQTLHDATLAEADKNKPFCCKSQVVENNFCCYDSRGSFMQCTRTVGRNRSCCMIGIETVAKEVQCCEGGAALFHKNRSREKKGGSGCSCSSSSSSSDLYLNLKKRIIKMFNNDNKLICPFM